MEISHNIGFGMNKNLWW